MCCMCGGRFSFLDHQTEHFIKHKDEVCCHLCQMKFSNMNSLALHLKNAHLKYHMFCKSCNMCMGPHVAKKWTVETDKKLTPVTPKKEPLDEEMEEVIIKNEEVEVEYVKEEVEEVVVGGMNETKENCITETPEDNKMANGNLQDHTYFSTQTCSSIREATNNVVMYTSSENVLVFINKTDPRISPKDSYTESDKQRASADDQVVCGVIHDHTYLSTQSFANPMLLEKHISAQNTFSSFCKTASNVVNSGTENIQVFNSKVDTRISTNDPENPESDQDQIWKHDHSYFSRQSCTNCEFDFIQEDAVVDEYKDSIQRINHKDSDSSATDDLVYTCLDDLSLNAMDSHSSPTDDSVYISQDDLPSVFCLSTDISGNTSKEGCKSKSWNACQKQENTNQTSAGSVDSINSYSSTSLYNGLEICNSCGLSKIPNAKKSMVSQKSHIHCTCTRFTCSVCGIVFGTEEMFLKHQAEKHPLTKYICARCLHLFPNQKIFLQHVCSNSKGFNDESFTPSKSTNNANEPLLTILNHVPPSASAEPSKQPLSSQGVNVKTTPNLETVLNSTSPSLPNSTSTILTKKDPVQVMTTKPSSCAQKTEACLVMNGDQGQVTTPISTVTQKQFEQVQVLHALQPKVVTQTLSSSSPTFSPFSNQILLLSSQGQRQITPISTVPQTKSEQMHNLTTLPTKVVTHTMLTSSIVLPQQHPSFAVPLPPFAVPLPPSEVSSSVSTPSQLGQLPESSVSFLDICRSSFSSSSQGPLKIVAMFVNRSKELALQKRMRQSWRSKAVFPCRQCGAVSRQFSLGVRHRYQHRGPRIHRCQCGRAFQQRMHLLRHQVQHAEATRYVCAACGQMFCGMQQLACHKPLFRITHSNRKKKANAECRNMFRCYCGHSFTRPAALLWHMLKNSKVRKSRLKGFRLT